MLKNIFKRKAKDSQPKEANKVTVAPPPPQLNFFQKAKLRFLEITRRSSRTITPPLSHCSGSSDYDSISISNSNIVSQYEEPEPIVRVNMAELLPMELLAHVVSFLPRKDINSLSRTNKTVQWRLNKQFREPIPIYLKLTRKNRGYLRVEVWVEGYHFCCNLIDPEKETEEICEPSKEQQLAEIKHFYTPGIEKKYVQKTKVFNFGIEEGLAAHLNALLSQNFLIKSLRLEHLTYEELNVVEKYFRENGTSSAGETCQPTSATNVPMTSTSKSSTVPKCPLVNKLTIRSETFDQIDYDLLVACKAKIIDMKCIIQMEGLLQTRTFRELAKIRYHGLFSGAEEGGLPSLTAPSIELYRVKGISSKDIQTFMNQWTLSRRTIEKLDLVSGKHGWKDLNLLSGVDLDLVTVVQIDNHDDDEKKCRLIRKSDGETLFCKWDDRFVSIVAENFESESISEYDSSITAAPSTSGNCSSTASLGTDSLVTRRLSEITE